MKVNCIIIFYFISDAEKVLDHSKDQRVDKASLPKGKELPLLIIYDSKKHSLKQVMELTIETFVREDSLIICTEYHKDELSGMTKECKILDPYSLSGIEAQWLVITADDQGWYFETLSRARNGLAIVLDTSADPGYVFMRCCYVSCALFLLLFMTFTQKSIDDVNSMPLSSLLG